MLENVLAHEENSSVWSMCLIPDKSGFVSSVADKTVRFWQFELIDDTELKTKKRLTFNSTKTLKLDDDALCVKIRPYGRLIAVALCRRYYSQSFFHGHSKIIFEYVWSQTASPLDGYFF